MPSSSQEASLRRHERLNRPSYSKVVSKEKMEENKHWVKVAQQKAVGCKVTTP